MTKLSAEETIELIGYISEVYPDDLEQALGQLEDIADLTKSYLEGMDPGKEIEDV